MFRLIEITVSNDKETQAIYPYETREMLEGNYEFKLGGAMEANTDELLIGLDASGNVLFSAKVGNHAFAPRLFEDKVTDSEEVDLKKYDTVELLNAKFHKIKGSAILNTACKQEILRGFDSDGTSVAYWNWARPINPVEPEPEPVEPTE